MTLRFFLATAVSFVTTFAVQVRAADEASKTPKSPDPKLKPTATTKMETITLGAGCFWCIEVILQRVKGVEKVVSGYSNGHLKNPTYSDICKGDTGHAEVVQVTFDTSVLPLEKMMHVFYDLHDPTTLNRQGHDTGTQYRSGIYYTSDAQKIVAEKVKAEVGKSGKFDDPIVTEIVKLDSFYPAEDYHQNYFSTNYAQGTGNQGYCRMVIVPKLKKMGLLKSTEAK